MKYQNLHNIIFSGNRTDRWKRHFLFWLAVFLYHLVRIGLMYPPEKLGSELYSLLEISFFRATLLNVLFSYAIVYFLIPRYFKKKKYFNFAAGIVLAFLFIQILGALYQFLELNQAARSAIGNMQTYKPGFIRLFGNPPLICCLLLSLKTLKNWHLEQLKTETLAKENTNAELQLLKAQVHPHFLFNTLNNIYSFTLNQSPLAGPLVRKLSDMLDYMIHECKETLVLLEKEIKLIQDYMGLEKVRYGNRLNLQIDIHGDYKNKMIAPLLLIPFVENCFKHGASLMRGQQWIRLDIHIKEDQLHFDLSNSKPHQDIDTKNKKGIGLANVQKRLQLLYPGKHYLKIESTSDTYIVHLQVSLQQLPALDRTYKLAPKLQPV